jgi:serine/threonine protein kinase
VLDFEEDPVQPYLVLEMVEGPSLSELISQSGRLSLNRASQVMRQIVDGLAALWALGAVHRDVKPGNILMTRAGTAKLADFGSAVLVEESSKDPEMRDEVAGTAAYMAPEQFLAPSVVDHRADVYALGATFYEAVTGRMPFEGSSRADLLMKHAKELPLPPHELLPELGPRVSDVILTMMAKDPDDRYQNADELRQAFAWLVETRDSKAETRRLGTKTDPVARTGAVPTPETETAVPEQPAADASPGRRPFWRALLPERAARPTGNEDWLRLVKRTLNAPPRKKG